MKYRDYDSIWYDPRPVFFLRAGCSASIRLGQSGSAFVVSKAKTRREKHRGKRVKDKKHKKSPKPNADIGSALGFYLIFVFVRSWSFSNVGSTVALGIIRVQSFPPELDAAHRSALAKAVSASPINLRAFTCLRKSEVRDHAGRLSESPNFLLPLMLKNSCRKLTQRDCDNRSSRSILCR